MLKKKKKENLTMHVKGECFFPSFTDSSILDTVHNFQIKKKLVDRCVVFF